MQYQFEKVISIVRFNPDIHPWPPNVGYDGTTHYCLLCTGTIRLLPGDFIVTEEDDKKYIVPKDFQWKCYKDLS